MVRAELVVDAGAELGESPCWDARTSTLWWVDMDAGRLHQFDPSSGSHSVADLGVTIGALAPRLGGGFVLADAEGFAAYDGGSRPGARRPLAPVLDQDASLR